MAPYVLVRVRAGAAHILVRGQILGRHSQFGGLHAVRPGDALRLVEAGHAKLLRPAAMIDLRAEVARLAGGDT